jgi:hypothetical protein
MESRESEDAAAWERSLANQMKRSRSSELRVISDHLMAQTATRIRRGKRLMELHRNRRLP